ncbi:MAG: hypothetical protein PHR13_11815 [Dysgonamonadaceae bacterium]|nr:hypothetical protein [Dysgonamonadaceae bacterium]
MFYRFKRVQKTCEGSLHPRPEGQGIRDPPRSRSNKVDKLLPMPLPATTTFLKKNNGF